ncbi:IS66 family transposase zinc-finger binding domain-containing protein, partial [Vibrio cincinnatiensis]|uniref:IS66 family transposase n=1 Tax=Vibrio cincinnatiensis TaxID=675 RepID=UPI001EE0BB10
MKKTQNINPESQDVTELQAMVKALMASENQLKQERQSLLEQLKLAFDRQFARRSEALKPYDESQGDLFNEAECEAAKEEEVEVTTTITTKKRGKRKPLPKTLPREVIELDLDDHEKQCACCKHSLHKIGEDRCEKLEFSPAVLKV